MRRFGMNLQLLVRNIAPERFSSLAQRRASRN
jgi:hypothetical protein